MRKIYIIILTITLLFATRHLQAEDEELALIGKSLSKGFDIGYFDNESNTPDSGMVTSNLSFDADPGNPNISIMNLNMNIPSGPSSYVGWYISPKDKTIDISNQTVLQFELRADSKIPLEYLQIGIRSPNLNSDYNRAKVFISELGYKTLPTGFSNIEIPVSMLLKREPDLNLKEISEVFIVSIVTPNIDLDNAKVSIKNLKWDWDFEKKENGELQADISSSFSFASGSYKLKEAGKTILNRLKKAIQKRKVSKVMIAGHTDSIGSKELNQRLSEKRAQAVANYLISIEALDKTQIRIKGLGSSDPIADNTTQEGRQANRRVEITILEQ